MRTVCRLPGNATRIFILAMIIRTYGAAFHPDCPRAGGGVAGAPHARAHERARRPGEEGRHGGAGGARALRALRTAPAARGGAAVGGRPVLHRGACAPRAHARPRTALMQAPLRYPELFLAPRERTPESFWISLGYFNLYRVALATLFLTLSVVYGDALNLGAHSLALFRYTCVAYLAVAVVLHLPLRRTREMFNAQLSLHACVDIVAITLRMYASGGMRSGHGVMLVVSLIAAAIVAPRRLVFLYAALATIALLFEQAYWVLGHDAPVASFVQPGLLAIGCVAASGVTGWMANRVAANERLAAERGRALATQMRVNELVQRDMHDGVLVLDREGRVVQHNPQAQLLLRAERLLGAPVQELLPRGAARGSAAAVRGPLPRLALGRRERRRRRCCAARPRHRPAAARGRHARGA